MKKSIHPQWFSDAIVTCACGNTFTVGATKQTIKVDVCAKCHPFFTGEMKFVDALGRVEKFQKMKQFGDSQKKALVDKKKKKKDKEEAIRQQKSLKDMLSSLR